MKLEAGELSPMTPVGETLRRERLKRNLDLEEISRELKISRRFLEAIEDDQYDKLPGGVFAKSFVRQYARCSVWTTKRLPAQVQRSIGPRSKSRSPLRHRSRRPSRRYHVPQGRRVADGRRQAVPLVGMAFRRRCWWP